MNDSDELFRKELKSVIEESVNLQQTRRDSTRQRESFDNKSVQENVEEMPSERFYLILSGIDKKSVEFSSLIEKFKSHENFKLVEDLKEIDALISENKLVFNREGTSGNLERDFKCNRIVNKRKLPAKVSASVSSFKTLQTIQKTSLRTLQRNSCAVDF